MNHHPDLRLVDITRLRTSVPHVLTLLLPFLILVCPAANAQQISVSASVNTTTVEPGETVRYTIRIESASTPPVTTPSPPEVEGLEFVRSSPRASRNISIVGGRIHQRMSFEWTLRATGKDKGEIGPTLVYIDESEHHTDPIEITITDRAATAQNGSSGARSGPPQHQPENVFIRARASDTDVYANEQLTVEYILYFREDFQVQNSRMANSWKADGLWREELKVDQNPLPETEVVNGLRYNTITLKRSAFFPTRSGSLTIDPLSIETEVLRPYRRNDRFNFRVPRDERLYSANISSPPVTVTARPLPANKPASFSGAVGSFTLEHEIDRTSVESGEAVTLDITVAGRGNISTLGEPAFDLPASVEVYDPQVTNHIEREGRSIEGRKTFSYTLVPETPGRVTLPSIEWSYFDPEREEFVTRETGPVELEVKSVDTPQTAVTNRTFASDDIAGLMPTDTSVGVDPTPLHRQYWPYAGVAGPAAALLLLLGFRRLKDRRALRDASPDRRARSAAKQQLSQAEEFRRREQSQAFHDAIERSLRGFIGARLTIPAQGLTKQQIDSHLERADIPPNVRADVRELLRHCEQARFSPGPPDSREMHTIYERTADCLSELDNLLEDHGPQPTRKS